MPSTLTIVLLPLFFLIHEVEEVLFFPSWTRRNEEALVKRFPSLRNRLHFLKSPAFVIAVVQEFIIITGCTIYSLYTGQIVFWYFCVLAFGLHFSNHLAQFIVLRRYIPSAVTTFICVPYSIYAYLQTENAFPFWENIILMLVSIIFFAINLLITRRVAVRLWAYICKRREEKKRME